MKQEIDSAKGVWTTPLDFFEEIQQEFHLEIDVAASAENATLNTYFDEQKDGLKQGWRGYRCWMNPPYGRGIGKWIKKAATSGAEIVVCLLPARTDTRWFHDYIYGKAEIRFLKGRLKFSGRKGGGKFPSMLVIFRGPQRGNLIDTPVDCTCNWDQGHEADCAVVKAHNIRSER
jgi:phage N-6-adenine-methyltransferase